MIWGRILESVIKKDSLYPVFKRYIWKSRLNYFSNKVLTNLKQVIKIYIMASTANRVIKNTSYLYIKMGITMFISLYITRLILNSLGASDFGIFNIVGGAISMLVFLNGSMAAATQRFMSYAEGENNESKKIVIFNSSIVLHLIIALFVGVLLEIGAFFYLMEY